MATLTVWKFDTRSAADEAVPRWIARQGGARSTSTTRPP